MAAEAGEATDGSQVNDDNFRRGGPRTSDADRKAAAGGVDADVASRSSSGPDGSAGDTPGQEAGPGGVKSSDVRPARRSSGARSGDRPDVVAIVRDADETPQRGRDRGSDASEPRPGVAIPVIVDADELEGGETEEKGGGDMDDVAGPVDHKLIERELFDDGSGTPLSGPGWRSPEKRRAQLREKPEEEVAPSRAAGAWTRRIAGVAALAWSIALLVIADGEPAYVEERSVAVNGTLGRAVGGTVVLEGCPHNIAGWMLVAGSVGLVVVVMCTVRGQLRHAIEKQEVAEARQWQAASMRIDQSKGPGAVVVAAEEVLPADENVADLSCLEGFCGNAIIVVVVFILGWLVYGVVQVANIDADPAECGAAIASTQKVTVICAFVGLVLALLILGTLFYLYEQADAEQLAQLAPIEEETRVTAANLGSDDRSSSRHRDEANSV